MQLAEMGIALHVEGGALGVFSPKNVSIFLFNKYITEQCVASTDPSLSKSK